MQDQKYVQEKVLQYQQIQQQTRLLLAQKQALDIQINEIDEAVSEIKKCVENDAIYKTKGNIMIKIENKDALLKELEDEKDTLNIRIKTLDKQSSRLKDRLKELQNEIATSVQASG